MTVIIDTCIVFVSINMGIFIAYFKTDAPDIYIIVCIRDLLTGNHYW